jgi:hypothetical protein
MNDKYDGEVVVRPLRSGRPRGPRVPVEFDLEIEGSTTAGEHFQVRARAVKISRGGATIILEHKVPLGSVVKVTPPFGSRLDAEVNGVWTDQSDGKGRIGVKLLDPKGWFADS